MPRSDRIEITTLGGQSLGRYTYSEYEREFGYSIVGRASTGPQKADSPKTKGKPTASKRVAPKKGSQSSTRDEAKSTSTNSKSLAREKKATESHSPQKADSKPAKAPASNRGYITGPWSSAELEKLETAVEALGEEAVVVSFVRTMNRSQEDVRSQIESLSNTKHSKKHTSTSPGNIQLTRVLPKNTSGDWTDEESALLIELGDYFTREELLGLFPNRRPLDVDARIKELGLRPVAPEEKNNAEEPQRKTTAPAKSLFRSRMTASAAGVKQRAKEEEAPRAQALLEPSWTKDEIELLRSKYRVYKHASHILASMFPLHSIDSVHKKARELKLVTTVQSPNNSKKAMDASSMDTRQRGAQPSSKSATPRSPRKEQTPSKPWSRQEDTILRRNYPIHGPEVRFWDSTLKGRKRNAIIQRASELGLRYTPPVGKEDTQSADTAAKPKNGDKAQKPTTPSKPKSLRAWTRAEDQLLRDNYGSHGRDWPMWSEVLPGISWDQIEARAEVLGIASAADFEALLKKFNRR